MGAAWINAKDHIPILIPPFDFKDIKGVIPTTQGMKIDDQTKLNSLKAKLDQLMGLESVSINVWERKKSKILKQLIQLLDDSSKKNTKKQLEEIKDVSNSLSSDEKKYFSYAEKRILELSKTEWPTDYKMRLDFIKRQTEAVQNLRNYLPPGVSIKEFKRIREMGRQEWPDDYEMQLYYEKEQVNSLKTIRNIEANDESKKFVFVVEGVAVFSGTTHNLAETEQRLKKSRKYTVKNSQRLNWKRGRIVEIE